MSASATSGCSSDGGRSSRTSPRACAAAASSATPPSSPDDLRPGGPAAAPSLSSLSVRTSGALARSRSRHADPALTEERRRSLGATSFRSPLSFHSSVSSPKVDPFFETDSIRVLPRSFHSTGEVPEEFRLKPVTLTAATNRITHGALARGSMGSPLSLRGASDFHARFTVAVHNQPPFNPSCESVSIEAGFLIARVVMEPLNIPDSQAIARGTTITAELFSGRRCIACMQSTLSALVWEDRASVMVGPTKRRLESMASLSVSAARFGGETLRQPVDYLFAEPFERDRRRRSDVVELHAGLSRRLSLRRLGKTLLFALSRFDSAGANGWKVFYRSKLAAGGAPPKCFSREFLLDGADLARTLRFSLLEMKDAFSSRLIAYSDLNFKEMADYTGDFPCKAETHQESGNVPVGLRVMSFMQREDGMLQLAILWEMGGRNA